MPCNSTIFHCGIQIWTQPAWSSISIGMFTTFPHCSFSEELPEIFSQNHIIYYHCLSGSRISKKSALYFINSRLCKSSIYRYRFLLTGRRICTQLVFDLFICPAVIDPMLYGLTSDVTVSHIARHNLMQVTLYLQLTMIYNVCSVSTMQFWQSSSKKQNKSLELDVGPTIPNMHTPYWYQCEFHFRGCSVLTNSNLNLYRLTILHIPTCW